MSVLTGRSILIVEDESLIALDMASEFGRRGARVHVANSLNRALDLVEADDLSAAVLDHGLNDGDSSILCERLKERHIPFLIYSGYDEVEGECATAPLIEKPAPMTRVANEIEALLRNRPDPVLAS